MPIRLLDKPERGHAERSSVAGAGGGRNGVEASRVISVDARTFPLVRVLPAFNLETAMGLTTDDTDCTDGRR